MIGKICWSCKRTLDGTESREHLLLNAIGGNLKTKGLLCEACQKEFGKGIDVVMAQQLNFFANRANIVRDRGAPQNIKGVHEITGIEYQLTPDDEPLPPSKPEIKEIEGIDGNTIYQIKAIDKKIAKKTLRGLARKHNVPEGDLTAVDGFKPVSEPLEGYLQFKVSLGGDEMFKATMKTALNIYFYLGGDAEPVSKAVEYCRGLTSMNLVNWFQTEGETIIKQPGQLIHGIVIKADPKEKIIYAYTEYFNVVKYICKLADNYSGPEKIFQYIFDVDQGIEIDAEVALQLTNDSLTKIIEEFKPNFSLFKDVFARFIQDRENKKNLPPTVEQVVPVLLSKLKEVQIRARSGEVFDFIAEIVDTTAKAIRPSLKNQTDQEYNELKRTLKPVIQTLLNQLTEISKE